MKIVNIASIEEVGVSHNPEIKKKVIIDRGAIPQLMTFGQATFLPGQKVEEHSHETMYEVFLIQSGKAIFIVEGKDFEVKEGDCITIEQKEIHQQRNPFDLPVTWLYFGIATD